MMYRSKIHCNFGIGLYNGSMSMQVYVNQRLEQRIDCFYQEFYDLELSTTWPFQLKFILDKKNMGLDTQINAEGKIIADKCIILKELYLDSIPVKEHMLKKLCKISNDQQIWFDNYWSTNSSIVIDFTAKNSLEWHLNLIALENCH